ncbi:SubName: Full=Uncharacterized protein {ECO:0000313/EMBL:CCA69798.1} [Serendipita indica DSM 11827]|uniref:BHLH domain-containing protein n=1 Tax=Serendipita indica (strain DSM 11827) TaxID=1109443 RepID=G4TEQ1_SERID|nr:SubName: Full=Uncharacterized protein {ECO:0000313/EMBL:CCA69798.1} [Serendipita indica DSM 11827]CCA69798.1 hypothetical protein PIIN_03739 [Serendipita indica DSM 11827]
MDPSHVETHKGEFEMFSNDYYTEQFDGFMFSNDPQNLPFDNLNISNQYYPATIAPSALTSSPHEFRRSDSPDATIVGPRNAIPAGGVPVANAGTPLAAPAGSYPVHPLVHALAAAAGESSSSPSSCDLQTVPIPSSAMLNGHVALPMHHLNHSTSSLSSVGADVGGRPRSSRNSPPSSSRDSPRTRARTPAIPGSPPKRNGGTLVHRHNRSTSSASTRPARRGSVRKPKEEDDFSDFEEDDDFAPHAASDGKPERRREDIRKQRIESEQRRRDELREGYNRLKQALPPSNQKSSKASILERATVCITELNARTTNLSARCEELENELRRVRVLNETLMLSAAEHRFAATQAHNLPGPNQAHY